MSRHSPVISLNSTESLSIPPRASSRVDSPLHPGTERLYSPSQLSRHSYPSHTSPKLTRAESDGGSETSTQTPPSPSHSPSPNPGHTRRRKPVPALLPMPGQDLPLDHPFSTARRSPGVNGMRVTVDSSSIHSGGSGSELNTPGWRDEKDLFFGSQTVSGATALSPSPRRTPKRSSTPVTAEPVMAPISLESPVHMSPVLDHRRGTFSGGLNINVPGMNPEASASSITTDAATSDGYETAQTTPSDRETTPAAPPRSTISPAIKSASPSPYHARPERPLPPLPADASSASLDMADILAGGPSQADIRTRSERGSLISPAPVSAPANKKTYSALGGLSLGRKNKMKEHLHGDEDEDGFSVSRIPTKRALWEAGTHFVRDENGALVYFGDLFPKWDRDSSVPPLAHTKEEFASNRAKPYVPPTSDPSAVDPTRPPPRTVLFFIRHFWCGQCQDYMFASVSQLDPEVLAKDNIRVVIISNGSWKLIKAYRKLTKCPFPVYVDGPRKLYGLMGMTKQTMDMGPWFNGRAAYNQSSVPGQLMNSIMRSPGMGLNAWPGKFRQLGGEFILEPGFECSFAHRMTNYSNHMEAPDILRLAGCAAPTKEEVQQNKIAEAEQLELERLQAEMSKWRVDREAELERIRRKKAERRGLKYTPISNVSRFALNLDATPAVAPERRESNVSEMSFMTATPGAHAGPAATQELDVSLDDVASGEAGEMEELEEEVEVGETLSEGELDERFERAMKIEEEAKGRFEQGRADTGVISA